MIFTKQKGAFHGNICKSKHQGFRKALKAGNYVDKTGLISYINSVLGTEEFETCFTRPRRFGKTTACNMLAAYYSSGAESKELFKGLEIEKDPTFMEHLNKHPGICFDLLAFMDTWKKLKPKKEKEKKPTLPQHIEETIVHELMAEYPEAGINEASPNYEPTLPDAMIAVANYLEEKQNAKKRTRTPTNLL